MTTTQRALPRNQTGVQHSTQGTEDKLDIVLESNREIYLSGLIDNNSALHVCSSLKIVAELLRGDTKIGIQALQNMIKEDALKEMQYTVPSATLYINSTGGYLGATTAIIHALREMPYQVVAVAAGDVFSAAAYIFAAADYRIASPLSVFMVHEPSYIQQGDLSQHRGLLDAISRQYTTWLEFFAERTGKDAAFWRDKIRTENDYYMTAEEALEYGLVDEILDYGMAKLGEESEGIDG